MNLRPRSRSFESKKVSVNLSSLSLSLSSMNPPMREQQTLGPLSEIVVAGIPGEPPHDSPFSRFSNSADPPSGSERVRESAPPGSVNPGTFPRMNLPRFPRPETIPAALRKRRTHCRRNSEMSFHVPVVALPRRAFHLCEIHTAVNTCTCCCGCNRLASECFFLLLFLLSSRILHSFLLRRRNFVHVADRSERDGGREKEGRKEEKKGEKKRGMTRRRGGGGGGEGPGAPRS